MAVCHWPSIKSAFRQFEVGLVAGIGYRGIASAVRYQASGLSRSGKRHSGGDTDRARRENGFISEAVLLSGGGLLPNRADSFYPRRKCHISNEALDRISCRRGRMLTEG